MLDVFLILTAPIHCRASIDETLMQCYISTNLMKKHTHLHHGLRLSTFSILAELLLQSYDECMCPLIKQRKTLTKSGNTFERFTIFSDFHWINMEIPSFDLNRLLFLIMFTREPD